MVEGTYWNHKAMNISDVVSRRLLGEKPMQTFRKEDIKEDLFLETWALKFQTTYGRSLQMILLDGGDIEIAKITIDSDRFFSISHSEVIQIRLDRPMYYPLGAT